MKRENPIRGGAIVAWAIMSSVVAWAQNPPVPVSQNALGTIGYYLNSSSGTAINKIATFSGAPSKVVTITAGSTGGAIGIISGGAGTAGNATVQITGYNVPCVFDGSTTAGHYVGISASVNGDCTDAGSTAPSGQSLGFVLSTNASGGTFKIDMTGSGGGGGGGSTAHVITIPIEGSPIAIGTGNVGLPNPGVNFSCTINSLKVIGNASGSITVNIWKANAAIPSSANLISASAPATLSSTQLNQSGSLAGWTTSVSVNDVFWATVATVDGALTNVTVQIGCQ